MYLSSTEHQKMAEDGLTTKIKLQVTETREQLHNT
jgi:hypothetical protein